MTAIIAGILFLFLCFFNTTAYAKNYGARICKNDPEFYCYTVKRHDSWASLYKDPVQKDLVMRINRMNTAIYPGMKIAVPKNLNEPDIDFSPFPKQINPPGEKVIFVSLDPNVLAFGAYDASGNLLYWGPVSGGQGYCPDVHRNCHTKIGTFAIYQKEGGGCYSTKFPVGRGGAPMPYCMFFHGGFALHGSYEVPGYNASHGCVRMFVNDAKWLNQDFTDIGTRVQIKY